MSVSQSVHDPFHPNLQNIIYYSQTVKARELKSSEDVQHSCVSCVTCYMSHVIFFFLSMEKWGSYIYISTGPTLVSFTSLLFKKIYQMFLKLNTFFLSSLAN